MSASKIFQLILLIMALTLSRISFAEEIFNNEKIGLEVTKPEAWVVLTAAENQKNLESIEYGSKGFKDLVLKYATIPVFAFSKYAEPYPDINPSFKINLRPAGKLVGLNAVQIASAIVPTLKRAFPEMITEQVPIAVTVSGFPAAYVRISYILSANGADFPTISELWIIPRGSHFFMIGAGTRQDETTGSRAEIQAIVDRIKIDPEH